MKLNFNRRNIVVFVIIIVVLLAGFFLVKMQKVEIATDTEQYSSGGVLKVRIRNFSLKNICFSSCYPYYLERLDGGWKTYNYQNCPHDDLTEKCCAPFAVKTFEIFLPRVKEGTHRVAVPVCSNCPVGKKFEEGKRFYSNEFEIR